MVKNNKDLSFEVRRFAANSIYSHTPQRKSIYDILNYDYSTLTTDEKFLKAIDRLFEGELTENSTNLEEATIILDDLSNQTEASPKIHTALTYVHALAGRFSEAADSLNKSNRTIINSTLEEMIQENIQHMRDEVRTLEFNPTNSYVAVYNPEIIANLNTLLNNEHNSEVVLTVDNIQYLDYIKNHFKDFLYTIETESSIHERFSPTSSNKLRVVLKNSNNNQYEKGLNLGIRKTKQAKKENIFELTSTEGVKHLATYIEQNKNIEDLIKKEQKIRIAFVCTTTQNTHGVPVVMNNIASQLALDSRYEVCYITNSFDNNEIKFKTKEGEERTFENRQELVNFLNKEGINIDILHSHTWHIGDNYKPFHGQRDPMDLPTFLKRLGSPKFIYTNHANPTEDFRKIQQRHGFDYRTLDSDRKREFLYRNRLDHVYWEDGWEATTILCKRELMDLADIVTYVSETQMHEEEEMIPHYVFQDKAQVVRNGIDIGKYNTPEVQERAQKLREELGINSNQKMILYAGRMDEEKGIYELAQAAQKLKQDGKDVVLVYLGSNSNETPEQKRQNEAIQQKIHDYAPYVRLLFPARIGREEREKMAQMYAAADVVAQPTWGECFNQVVAEGLAMGTPAVVSDFSAPGEIYVRPGAALGCAVRNPQDLASKLETALYDNTIRAQITERGTRLVQEDLTVEAMANRYKNLYERLN